MRWNVLDQNQQIWLRDRKKWDGKTRYKLNYKKNNNTCGERMKSDNWESDARKSEIINLFDWHETYDKKISESSTRLGQNQQN